MKLLLVLPSFLLTLLLALFVANLLYYHAEASGNHPLAAQALRLAIYAIIVLYVPNKKCVELKSLKLYLWSFRDEGHFFEQVTNQILDDLVRATTPRRMTVIGRFNVRGGITTQVVARYAGRRGR